MRSRLKILSLVLVLFVGCKEESRINEQYASQNIEADFEEWIDLFNGENLENWEIKIAGHRVGENYKNTFVVKDSLIRVSYEEYENFDNAFGHLYYKEPLSYYKLKLDYRFTGEQVPGGQSWALRNSGVMLHSQAAQHNDLGQFFPVSLEFQFLGGLDNGERTTGNLCTPGTAVTIKDSINYTHCITSLSKTYNGDKWVSIEAVVLGDERIFHIVENDTVLSYTKPVIGGGLINRGQDGEWKAMGFDSQQEWLSKDNMPLKEGYIALQAESSPVDFRNIKLLNLCGCMDKKAKNYKSYYVKADNSSCIYD